MICGIHLPSGLGMTCFMADPDRVPRMGPKKRRVPGRRGRDDVLRPGRSTLRMVGTQWITVVWMNNHVITTSNWDKIDKMWWIMGWTTDKISYNWWRISSFHMSLYVYRNNVELLSRLSRLRFRAGYIFHHVWWKLRCVVPKSGWMSIWIYTYMNILYIIPYEYVYIYMMYIYNYIWYTPQWSDGSSHWHRGAATPVRLKVVDWTLPVPQPGCCGSTESKMDEPSIFQSDYPLVMTNIAIENHHYHFLWENSL